MGDGDGNARLRRVYAHQNGDEDSEDDGGGGSSDEATSDDSEQDSDGDASARLPALDPAEEALADAAMARIQRAQAKGKKDVKLSKAELEAYQRRLRLMEEEERRQRRKQRVVVPLSQLGPGPRKRLSPRDDSPPSPQGPAELGEERPPGYPPMGYFPPPAPRPRQRSGTISSRPPSQAATDREQSSSPFTYSYVHRADHSASGASPASAASQSQGGQPDPFQYMTAGTRTSYHAAAGPTRNSIIEVDDIYASYGSGAPSGGVSHRRSGEARDGETSNEEDGRHGARVSGASGGRARRRESSDSRRDPVPASRDRTPPPAKKSASVPSPAKRKSVAGSSKSGRRKGK